MASQISGKALLLDAYGTVVQRAAGNLPATTNAALFNITGGRIIVTGIYGLVTTAIQAQATTLGLTTLSATNAITTALSAATLDITGLAAGNMVGMTGVRADALLTGSNVPQNNEVVVTTGSIRWVTGATSTGAMSWTLTYVPLDSGAYVTAA